MFFKQIIFKTTWELLKRTLSDFSMLSPRPDDDISPQAEVSRYFIWQRQHRPKLLPKEHLRSEPRQNLNCQHYSDVIFHDSRWIMRVIHGRFFMGPGGFFMVPGWFFMFFFMVPGLVFMIH